MTDSLQPVPSPRPDPAPTAEELLKLKQADRPEDAEPIGQLSEHPQDGSEEKYVLDDYGQLVKAPADALPVRTGPNVRDRSWQLMVLALVLVVALVSLGMWAMGMRHRGAGAGPPARLATSTPAPSAAATAAAQAPTAPTPLGPGTSYAAGLEAYAQADWPKAATAFEQVHARDPGYLEVREKLASTYYNWGVAVVRPGEAVANSATTVREASEHFRAALAVKLPAQGDESYQAISTTHRLAGEALTIAGAYTSALKAQQDERWDACITAYEEVTGYTVISPFLDAPERLYAVYLVRARELQVAEPGRARELLAKAVELDVEDASEAVDLLASLRPSPTATPRPPAKRYLKASVERSFAGSGNNGTFESCISGSVSYGGAPIDGAVIGVNNGQGNNYFRAVSGSGGLYKVCGLGASAWSVVLFYIPGSPELGNQPVEVVYVNGNRGQEGRVSFAGP